MGMLNMPKAMYKAQQAKKQMSKIEAAGAHGSVSVLMNGLNEIVEVEIDVEDMIDGETISKKDFEKAMSDVQNSFKKAVAEAKKRIEKEMMSSANLDDIKGMLGM
jgi:DNA-binding protein YbaB